MSDFSVLSKIQFCFKADRVLYTRHAREEMLYEEFGKIFEEEVYQAIQSGEVIESYEYDTPYPSILIWVELILVARFILYALTHLRMI